jgi:hypothetical protein
MGFLLLAMKAYVKLKREEKIFAREGIPVSD